ncbi:MAG: hypothetical protein A2288_01550 [Candidatus Moranbacteria bacterium RIFOXYA12_FULL_44_15]|nr:MAG: hypothetical protein A2288_01550 [Candidatus Moranbacteria bacterium RIFOXYA12_FULL_44_15]OGI35649.1 MAG: hypothetical protein A2259_01450 [Candidatus Moranbacteria bacterium RIFOXYA2_FULL_43_15]
MEGKKEKGFGSWMLKTFLFFGLAALIFIGISAGRQTLKKKEIKKEIEDLKKEAEKIEKDNLALEDKIAYLESRDYQEKEARDKLGLQKPEENLVIIKPGLSKKEENRKDISENQGREKEPEKTFNPRKWWNYFFKY